MNPKSTYIELLRIAADFSEDEINTIKKCIEVKKYAKGELLLREGEYSDTIIYISEGLLREFYYTPPEGATETVYLNDFESIYEDDTYTSWIMAEGNFVYNVRSFLENTPSKCYIKAEEDSVVITMPKTDLDFLLGIMPQGRKILGLFYEKALIEYERRLELLREKDTLIRYQKFIELYPHLHQRISLKKIATYLNISPRHLSRIRALPIKK
ncbi:Crp/Fnr family transcriptional regulator [Emticicia soli]|uniref:Cyclic nucleotide-binding domain-containing protein n=1 Tax=Emticicia soli TaxID=2027878 RepID=A0ABW5JBQ1_9BACT